MPRGKERQTLLRSYPDCAYCAGVRVATTVDHFPPKQMFPKGQRPKGLETPSCAECNSGARRCESLLSFFAQLKFSNLSKADEEQFEQIGAHLLNNHPDLLAALMPTTGQLRRARRQGEDFGAMDLRSSIVSNELLRFGAKCGLALHWHHNKQPLTQNGHVVVFPFSNDQAKQGEIPTQLFEWLTEQKTLQQGRKSVSSTFVYSSGSPIDSSATVHWATFGQAVCYQLFVGTDLAIPDVAHERVFSPGFLAE